MELNKINDKGRWDGTATSLNDNFAKVNAELEKLKAANIKFKGFFSSTTTLSVAHPRPTVGDTAWVGNTYPGMVYECKSAGVWANTNKAPVTPSVELTDYAKTELLDKRTTEYNVSVQHPSSGIDGTNKFTLALAIALVPSPLRTVGIKCSFLNDAGTIETWEYQGGAFAATSSWTQGGAQKVAELTTYTNYKVSKIEGMIVGSHLFDVVQSRSIVRSAPNELHLDPEMVAVLNYPVSGSLSIRVNLWKSSISGNDCCIFGVKGDGSIVILVDVSGKPEGLVYFDDFVDVPADVVMINFSHVVAVGFEKPMIVGSNAFGMIQNLNENKVDKKTFEKFEEEIKLSPASLPKTSDFFNKGCFVNGNKVFTIYNPYGKTRALKLKGALHCHTTNSDGYHSALAVCNLFKENGFDFLTITDHNYITPEPEGNTLVWLGNSYENTSVPPDNPATYQHVCVYDVDEMLVGSGYDMYRSHKTVEEIIDKHVLRDGRAVNLAHPNWSVLYYPDESLQNVTKAINFMECWNEGETAIENWRASLSICCRAWDILLTRGLRIFGISVDDFHKIEMGYGCVEVFSDTKTKDDIWLGLLEGNFISSNGRNAELNPISVTAIELTKKLISISINNIATIRFIGKNGTLLKSVQGITAQYEVIGTEQYVRIEIWNGYFGVWLQPFFIEDVRTYTF